MRPKPRRHPLTGDVREQVWARSGECCEGCGRGLDRDTWECHHRRTKGMGGSADPATNAPVNLLALCPSPCHADATSGEPWTWDAGLRVKQYANPADIPVLYRGRRLVFLTETGELEDAA